MRKFLVSTVIFLSAAQASALTVPPISECNTDFGREFFSASVPRQILTNLIKEVSGMREQIKAKPLSSSGQLRVATALWSIADLLKTNPEKPVYCDLLATMQNQLEKAYDQAGGSQISELLYYPAQLKFERAAWAEYFNESGHEIADAKSAQ